MPIPGQEIHRSYDSFGPIQVFDDGNKRYLAFGNDDEQSCLLKSSPWHLQYDYTRAMLLPLLFSPSTEKLLLLGLGAGSLANCLFHHLTEAELTVIELRQQVIDVAFRYFELPRDERLKVSQGDANDYLATTTNTYSCIFSDIYSADGLDDSQIQAHYLQACSRLLNNDGWLILNCWREHRGNQTLLEQLKEHFTDIRLLTTQSGNWIILAAKRVQSPSDKQLKTHAKRLSEQLGFSLLPVLKNLQVLHRCA